MQNSRKITSNLGISFSILIISVSCCYPPLPPLPPIYLTDCEGKSPSVSVHVCMDATKLPFNPLTEIQVVAHKHRLKITEKKLLNVRSHVCNYTTGEYVLKYRFTVMQE